MRTYLAAGVLLTCLTLPVLALDRSDFEQGVPEEKVYRLGLEIDYPPFEFHDQNGNRTGFEIDLMEAIAKAEGLKVEYEESIYDNMVPRLLGGDFDALLGGNALTYDRSKQMLYSNTILKTGQGLVINNYYGSGFVNDPEDLRGKVLCVEAGAMGERYAKTVRNAVLKSYGTVHEVVDAFNTGVCPVAVLEFLVLQYMMKQGKIVNGDLYPQPVTSTDVVVLVNPQRQEFLDRFNSGLAKLRADGTYDAIYRKWFHDSPIGKPLENGFILRTPSADGDNYPANR
ncbi:MAG: amino acid ABC transporter substrate-binding protein [Succinivibrio sp.]|nr:amino acid ABC transporter substrate-binding protein [Succinivibrio sp.]